VGVEKLPRAKFANTKSRYDALQTTFSVFPDIFYPPNFRCFEGNGVFNTHACYQQLLSELLVTRAQCATVKGFLHGTVEVKLRWSARVIKKRIRIFDSSES
jgi:hypothetical protein